MKKIRIKADSALHNGNRMYRITGISSVKNENGLPDEYRSGFPHCWWASDPATARIDIFSVLDETSYLYLGGTYSSKEFKGLINVLKGCAERLRDMPKGADNDYANDGQEEEPAVLSMAPIESPDWWDHATWSKVKTYVI